MTKDEALKLALEALNEVNYDQAYATEIAAIKEALAEQETVLPGGGHVPAVPVAVYGYCPECGGVGVMRERRPNGDDKCTNGHKYPSSKALAEQPAQPKRCQCPACKIAPHASDCPVHNEPAWPNGPCDCGAQPYPDNFIDALMYDVAKRDSEAQQAYEDAFINGTGVMLGDKRIDPASIYKEPEQEPVALPEKIYEFVPTPEPVKWHHPECEGQCIACLIEQLVQEAYGSQGLGYLQRHLTTPPHRKPLTDDQIAEATQDIGLTSPLARWRIARAIEAAHGIGEKPDAA